LKAFHIKSNNEQLYTVLHSPKNIENSRKHTVVICSPITHEHDTCYWAMRQLAFRLSRLGFHVVRFDYFASGNSAGLSQQITLNSCVQNIVNISQYIIDQTNSEKLTYIGLRLGAVLATMSSIKRVPDQMILWDPLIIGKKYINELAQLHKTFLNKMKRTKLHSHNLGTEYVGYPYSEIIIDEINSIQLSDMEIPVDTALSVLTSPENTEQKAYIKKLSEKGITFQHEETSAWPINSEDINTLDSSYLPSQSINQICKILKAIE